MSISMTVKGLDKAIKTSSGMSDDLRHAYRIAMQTEVEKLADDTQQMVPVLTGFLKSTVYIEPPTQEDDISLGYGAYYAGIVNARVPYFTEEYERWRPTLAVRIKRLALELFIRGDPTFNSKYPETPVGEMPNASPRRRNRNKAKNNRNNRRGRRK